ncbi:uncharacterized protein PAC_05427 [Phialocephala subalpina]|uniref:Guanylate cyclase domain-containing protein n=1 Tax=Phialocephala subalpina TaxID=576137 RepID=A0A1L7WRZ8_9HELO|nr:uncharacterized protein PAC_05427 [Phialocephala subalpina]
MSPIQAPHGPMTILFIDLIDSSSLWLNDTEVMIQYRRYFYKLIRKQILKHQGYEVRPIGDGFLIVFAHATNAIKFSLAVQTKLPAKRTKAGLGSLEFEDKGKARIGIHFGTPADSEPDGITQRWDYWGADVNVAQRIENKAGAGCIAVSAEFLDELLRITNVADDELVRLSKTPNIQEGILERAVPRCLLDVRSADGREELRGCGEWQITSISLKR